MAFNQTYSLRDRLILQRKQLDASAIEAHGQPFIYQGQWFRVDPTDGTIKGGYPVYPGKFPPEPALPPDILEDAKKTFQKRSDIEGDLFLDNNQRFRPQSNNQ